MPQSTDTASAAKIKQQTMLFAKLFKYKCNLQTFFLKQAKFRTQPLSCRRHTRTIQIQKNTVMVGFLLFFRRQCHIIAKCLLQISVISNGDRHIFSLKRHKYGFFKPFLFVFLFHIKWSGTQFRDVITLGNRILGHVSFRDIPDLIADLFPTKYRKQKAASHSHHAPMFFRYSLRTEQLIDKCPHTLKFTFPFSIRIAVERNHIQSNTMRDPKIFLVRFDLRCLAVTKGRKVITIHIIQCSIG